jgi:hypothetical protein
MSQGANSGSRCSHSITSSATASRFVASRASGELLVAAQLIVTVDWSHTNNELDECRGGSQISCHRRHRCCSNNKEIKPMKMILAGVAFATLMAAPVFAQPQRNEGTLASVIYQKQKQQVRVDYDGRSLSASKSKQPTSNPDPMEQWPCSTAPDFCPDYHGDND